MRTTLLVENDHNLENFYEINLHTWVGAKVLSAPDAKFAIDCIQKNPDIELIIAKGNIKNEKTAAAIAAFLQQANVNCELIVIGHSDLDPEIYDHILSGLDAKKLVQAAAKRLGVTAKDMAMMQVPDFFPIPAKLIATLEDTNCDIYEENEFGYGVLYQAFNKLPPNKAQYITENKIENFYVKKSDRLIFVSYYNQEVASTLDFLKLDENEQINQMELAQNLLQEKIARMGITDETVELAKKNMTNMGLTAKRTSSLKSLLKRLMSNKAGYLFKHSQILMFVTAHLMENLDWGTKEQIAKIQFVSFFHDIALENDQQAQIHTEQDLRASDLPKDKKELIKKHAQDGATILSKYPNAPMGVEQIIKQHHGTINGYGFSEHYSQNISPMAIVFILAEDFVDEVINSGLEFNMEAKIAQMRERFSTQRFKKILDVMETVVVG